MAAPLRIQIDGREIPSLFYQTLGQGGWSEYRWMTHRNAIAVGSHSVGRSRLRRVQRTRSTATLIFAFETCCLFALCAALFRFRSFCLERFTEVYG